MQQLSESEAALALANKIEEMATKIANDALASTMIYPDFAKRIVFEAVIRKIQEVIYE